MGEPNLQLLLQPPCPRTPPPSLKTLPPRSVLWPNGAKAGEVVTLTTGAIEEAGAAVAAAEVGRPEPQLARRLNLLKPILPILTKNLTRRAPDTPMGLQVQPVLAIGPKAGPRPTAVTLLSVDG